MNSIDPNQTAQRGICNWAQAVKVLVPVQLYEWGGVIGEYAALQTTMKSIKVSVKLIVFLLVVLCFHLQPL